MVSFFLPHGVPVTQHKRFADTEKYSNNTLTCRRLVIPSVLAHPRVSISSQRSLNRNQYSFRGKRTREVDTTSRYESSARCCRLTSSWSGDAGDERQCRPVRRPHGATPRRHRAPADSAGGLGGGGRRLGDRTSPTRAPAADALVRSRRRRDYRSDRPAN